MSSEVTYSIREDEDLGDQGQRLLISIEENFELEPSNECCIYRVPKRLRLVNERAYTPQLVSIGPLHHGKSELAGLENEKESYLGRFLKRTPVPEQDLLSYIRSNERRIRNCYAKSSKPENLDFVKMILYDAIFILELFIRKHNKEDDFYLKKPMMYLDIYIDIVLLENQLPYFVLHGLYKLALDSVNKHPSLKLLCCTFFGNEWINTIPGETLEVLHLTDLCRRTYLKDYPSQKHLREVIYNLPNAVKLHESGVKFEGIDEDCSLNIKLEVRKDRIPCFKVTELQIPVVPVIDRAEPETRNIMALEQLHYPGEAYFCNYIGFLDRLIETEKDVDLLHEKGIIVNFLSDNASVANMFNKLCNEIIPGESCYYTISQDLEAHYGNPWNHTKAMLKSVYFNNLWRGTATVAAVVLLLLTVTQTVFSIL